jgi:hypothetical protein
MRRHFIEASIPRARWPAPSDLARQVMWSYTFYRPSLTKLHQGLWQAVDLLDV